MPVNRYSGQVDDADVFYLLLFCHNSRSKVNFKVKYIFLNNKLRKRVIPLFHGILSRKSISGIILMIQGHLQGQEVNFKVKLIKMSFLTTTIRNKCNNSFWCDFDYRIYL